MSLKAWGVWAIKFERGPRAHPSDAVRTVAVSAESEYGAIKAFTSSKSLYSRRILAVCVIPGRAPKTDARKVEGFINYDFPEQASDWAKS